MKTLLPKEQTWGWSKHVRGNERFPSLAQFDKFYQELKSVADPDQAFGEQSNRGAPKRLHLLNIPGSLWQPLGIT